MLIRSAALVGVATVAVTVKPVALSLSGMANGFWATLLPLSVFQLVAVPRVTVLAASVHCSARRTAAVASTRP